MADQYISGDWKVRAGREEEFVARWLDFTGGAQANARGARSFVLLRDAGDPGHFVSFGTWTDLDAVNAWRSTAEFSEGFRRCRELCEQFSGGDYTVAASPALVG